MAKQEFEFTLILSGVSAVTGEVLDAFYEAGCDDALIGMRDGVAYADFCRAANSYRVAVLSAIADVESAGVCACVVRLEPDELVTMSEIARRTRRSRESIRQLATGLRGSGDFPPPVASLKQKSPIWRWTDVAQWFAQKQEAQGTHLPDKGGSAAKVLLDANVLAAVINGTLEIRRHIQTVDQAMELFKVLLEPRRPKRRGIAAQATTRP